MREQIEALKERIRPHLVEYLQEQGIDPHHQFTCPNPRHEDKNPSAGLLPGKDAVFCFAESKAFDIFDCAAFLENKPLVGKAFIYENVMYLAKKFGIETELEEPTESEIYELDTYRAYKLAADIIMNSKFSKQVKQEIERRGWSETNTKSHMVGSVKDFNDFREQLMSAGFSAKFLDQVDLGKRGTGTGLPSPIFQPNCLIFTICDEHGRPVGFAARNLDHKPGDKQNPKYVNQMTTGVECNIYRKGERLYGIHVAKRDPKIYIFEGYTDVITAREKGLQNCVAVCSNMLTKEQVILLKKVGATEVVICLDGDEAGQSKIEKILDERLAGHKEIIAKVKLIPEEMDPDDYIRAHGIEAFRNLPELSAFQWRLTRFSEDAEGDVIAHTMLPLIVSEPSHISQESMCRDLCARTGIDLKILRMELHRLLQEKNSEKLRERNAITERAALDLERYPANAEAILTASLTQLTAINIKYDEAALSELGTVNLLKAQKEAEESRETQHIGFKFGPKFQDLQVALAGELHGTLLALGGRGNAGKSSVLAAAGHDIATHYEENNTMVIYHTIDDTPEQLLPKFICIQEGSHDLELNHVMFPKHYEGAIKNLAARRARAYAGLTHLVEGGWLLLKGAFPDTITGGGNTLTFSRTLLSYLRTKFPERHILYILDNFHKLQDFQGDREGNESVRIRRMSNTLKGLATEFGITVWATMEYTKLIPGTRPNMNNIAGAAAMQYDANWVAHIYNDVHDKGPLATVYHLDEDSDGGQVKLPRIELIVEKNKIASFKSSIYLNFWPSSSDFGRVSPEEAMIAREAMRTANVAEDTLRQTFGGKKK